MIKEVQKYIDFLLEELHLTNDVLGILLYGSYILNEEDEYSDFDVLIVVEENSKSICGRGNIIKDNIPIEYFIKTENDIYKEPIDELENLEPAMRIELLTGTVIFEKYNTLDKLIKRAEEINLMPYKPLSNIEIEGITITLRNQLNEINRKNKFKEKDLYFCYYNYLYELIKAYCDYEKVLIRKYKFYKTYTNEDYRIKNMQLDIKDEYIKSEFIYLISNFDINRLNDLTIYILNKIERMDFKMENRLWVTPNNDLEAKTIVEMLQREGEDFLVTGQAWGASWEKLEEELKAKIEEAKREQKTVYGVELQGDPNGAINVDHHTYGEDDRSNPKSSIEQVAEILGVELTLDEKFVSANDKGYIPAMEKLGAELGLSVEDLKEIIANIRMRDREMQGVTPEQEAQAQEAVEKLGEIAEKREYIQLDLPHSKTSTVTDRLYGKYDNLLITSGDGETNFYGTTEIIQMLNERFPGGWSGGQLDQGSGFWGGYADQSTIKAAVQTALQKTIDSKDNREEI